MTQYIGYDLINYAYSGIKHAPDTEETVIEKKKPKKGKLNIQ